MRGVVVVGTSFGTLAHVPALRGAGFEIIALVGQNAERTARRARILGIPHATTSVAEALALVGVEAISIATPPRTHAEIALAAIAAGKHVICEKPLAASAAEAAAIRDAAETAGVVGLVGHELRWLPAQVLLEQAVGEGRIGEPRLATFVWLLPGLATPDADAPAWWTDEQEQGGWLGANASHMVNQVQALFGDIAAVSGGMNVVSDHDWTAEDSFTVHFRTRTGVEGVIQSSYAAYGPAVSIQRISGSKGSVWVEGNFISPSARVWLADGGGARELEVAAELAWQLPEPLPGDLVADLETQYARNHASGSTIPMYTRLATAFRDLIDGNPAADVPRLPTFAAGVRDMLVLDAIRSAAAGEGWVTIPA